MQKLDPYINVDPGTMSPYQHGEVYVLDDGSETDLDLGHYERFTNAPSRAIRNYTTGQIYLSRHPKRTPRRIPRQHRPGDPARHRRNQSGRPQSRQRTSTSSSPSSAAPSATSKACRFWKRSARFALDIGKQNCLYIHLTLVPYLKAAGEMKTKPTQHCVGQLRQIGIQPDILICRTERATGPEDIDKIALFCNVEPKAVIEETDKEFCIYEVPVSLVEHRSTS